MGFRGSNASGGRIVLLPGAFWAHGTSKMATLGASLLPVFYRVSELRRACFRQARVARAVLPPGALLRAGAFALILCAPKSHMRPPPHLGVSDKRGLKHLIFVENPGKILSGKSGLVGADAPIRDLAATGEEQKLPGRLSRKRRKSRK